MIDCLSPSDFAAFLSLVANAVETLGEGVIRVGPKVWTLVDFQWCITGEAA